MMFYALLFSFAGFSERVQGFWFIIIIMEAVSSAQGSNFVDDEDRSSGLSAFVSVLFIMYVQSKNITCSYPLRIMF